MPPVLARHVLANVPEPLQRITVDLTLLLIHRTYSPALGDTCFVRPSHLVMPLTAIQPLLVFTLQAHALVVLIDQPAGEFIYLSGDPVHQIPLFSGRGMS